MLGQHEVLVRLAAGGAANVFLVRDSKAPPPGRLVALKVLLPSLAANEDFINMFFTEARIAQRLDHPNVVAITGFGQAEGTYCLAMEYVFGASLAQVLRASARARKPLTVGVLLRITAQVCDALHYAHELRDAQGKEMGLVHRDVTPQNILIGFNGVPKLTDFGIAKATNRGWETQAGIVKGKFSYMSPEQAIGKKVDRRSDIFGTGIVLWEALTGKELFKGTSPMEVIEAIRSQAIIPPSKVVPGLSPIVDPIVMKALRRAPRQRYQTALEMKREIEDLIGRAGVRIDAETISKEFAEIFGETIVERAFVLRSAMAGRADLDELARVLGAQRMKEEHLPVIPGGASHPDPLGLFSDSYLEEVSVDAEMEPEASMPARADEGFTKAFPTLEAKQPLELEVDLNDDADEVSGEEEGGELLGFEIDEAPPSDAAVVVDGWEDSTRMMQPSDELLAMLSEQDATVGMLPPEFAARFGTKLRVDRPQFDDLEGTVAADDFDADSERTVDASASQAAKKMVPAKAPKLPEIAKSVSDGRGRVEPYRSSSRHDGQRGSRIIAPSVRPVPRAPSLDMDDGVDGPTPLPDFEALASPRPLAPPPPPPPRRIDSSLNTRGLMETEDDGDLPAVPPAPLEEPRFPSGSGLPPISGRLATGAPHAPSRSAFGSDPRGMSSPEFQIDPPVEAPPPTPLLSPGELRELVERDLPSPSFSRGSSHSFSQINRGRNAIKLRPVGLALLALVFVVLGLALGILMVKFLPQLESLLSSVL